ncbi:VOC family protein [Streptomyces sp. NPDC056390]|uniref:VOC family protein n=1 Tax=Streptomyces sp. NPDC056390 TaxID=3345806 RepID=UPI0035DECE5E
MFTQCKGALMRVSFSAARFVVSDIDRSLAFYEGVLGMKPTHWFRYSDPDIVEVTLTDGDGRPCVVLLAGEEAPVHSGMKTYGPVVFFVEDAMAASADIAAAGYDLAIDPPVSLGPAVAAMALDPDGYQIELLSFAPGVDPASLLAAPPEDAPQAVVPHPAGWIHQQLLR